jgi:hypothetical protein
MYLSVCNFVQNCMMKFCPKTFRPRWRFVKSTPGQGGSHSLATCIIVIVIVIFVKSIPGQGGSHSLATSPINLTDGPIFACRPEMNWTLSFGDRTLFKRKSSVLKMDATSICVFAYNFIYYY